jgi:mitochondrial fission protein ELM1
LIILSGGKAVFAAKSLATKYRAPLVFIGERKPYPSNWFHTVLTPSEYERDSNDIALRKIPISITFAQLEQAANAWTEKPDGRLWTMVLGGKSLSHRYSESDWKSLGHGMNQLAERHGIRWLIASSRRTGIDAEKWLSEIIQPKHLAEAAWWAQSSSGQLHAYLGAAERVFVTQDSVTMVTETTVCKSTPVVLAPADVNFPDKSFLPHYFKALEEDGQIVRKKISELGDLDISAIESADSRKNTNASIAETLLGRLGFASTQKDLP